MWDQGVADWSRLLRAGRLTRISDRRLGTMKEFARQIISLESQHQMRELGMMLPPRERWRLLDGWDGRFAAMDVEAIRIHRSFVPVMLTIRRGDNLPRTLIRGDDLCWRQVDRLLSGVDFLVTFNGSSFDIPLLEDCGYGFGSMTHLDLRRYCLRADLRGNLKEIEKTLGIVRPREIEFSTSEQVAYLWRLWEERGSRNALEILTRYNRQDADSLVELARHIYETLAGSNHVREG